MFFFANCGKLATSTLCTLVKLISYELFFKSPIIFTSPSRPLTIHLFQLTTDKSFLTASKLSCNLGTLKAFFMQISFLFFSPWHQQQWNPFQIAFILLLSPKWTLCGVIIWYVSNVLIKNHMFRRCIIHDSCIHSLYICFMLCCKCVVISFFWIVCIIFLLVLCVVTKRTVWPSLPQ